MGNFEYCLRELILEWIRKGDDPASMSRAMVQEAAKLLRTAKS